MIYGKNIKFRKEVTIQLEIACNHMENIMIYLKLCNYNNEITRDFISVQCGVKKKGKKIKTM